MVYAEDKQDAFGVVFNKASEIDFEGRFKENGEIVHNEIPASLRVRVDILVEDFFQAVICLDGESGACRVFSLQDGGQFFSEVNTGVISEIALGEDKALMIKRLDHTSHCLGPEGITAIKTRKCEPPLVSFTRSGSPKPSKENESKVQTARTAIV